MLQWLYTCLVLTDGHQAAIYKIGYVQTLALKKYLALFQITLSTVYALHAKYQEVIIMIYYKNGQLVNDRTPNHLSMYSIINFLTL